MKENRLARLYTGIPPDRLALIAGGAAFIPVLLLVHSLYYYLDIPKLKEFLPIIHISVQCLSVFVFVSVFLMIWHTFDDRKDLFLMCIGGVFLLIGLTSLLQIANYQGGRVSGGLVSHYSYHYGLNRLIMPSGLLIAASAIGKKSQNRKIRLACIMGVSVAFLTLISSKPILQSCSSFFMSSQRNEGRLWDLRFLSMPIYATAIYVYYKRKPFIDLRVNALFLVAIYLLAYGESCQGCLCFKCKDCPFRLHNPFSHCFEIASYLILYWVLFLSSVRYPHKALVRLKEDLTQNYLDLSAALTMLEQSEERYRLLVENSNDLIFILSPRGRIIFANQNILAITGYSMAEVLGKRALRLLTPDSRETAARATKDLLKTGSISFPDISFTTKSGKQKTVMVNLRPMFNPENVLTGFQGIAIDISDRKNRQEQMFHAEKMATVGFIASGMAHEIGTPLNVISGNAEFLISDLPPHHPMREELETIIDECERISDQIKSLLGFARPLPLFLAPVDINAAIQDAIRLLRHAIKSGHIVHFDLEPALPTIMGDKSRLQQMIVNLLLNALQSMPSDGMLMIRSMRQVDPETGGVYLVLSFQDSGCGVEKENLKHIFDPFFTTKSPGQGTGLGLAVCMRIAKEHGGTIDVRSKINEGATFSVRLPLIPAERERVLEEASGSC